MTRTPAYYQALTAPSGYLRLKTISQPSFAGSSSAFDGNIITVVAISDGTGWHGAPVTDSLTQFFSVAMVAIPNVNAYSTDTLISAAAIKSSGTFAPILKQANSQVGFKWSLQIGG